MGNQQRTKYKHRHATPAQQEALARARDVWRGKAVEEDEKRLRRL